MIIRNDNYLIFTFKYNYKMSSIVVVVKKSNIEGVGVFTVYKTAKN